ncbi:MAG: CPBP family intramembrane metalloprotease [Halioglobus sp.]|nr:CPBP family intramembrane metalloprotease [Halioglobus sp.]
MPLRDFLRRHYLPDNFPTGATLGLAATGVFVALVTLLLEFYGWQQPFLRMAAPVFGLEGVTHNDLLFYAQLYTSASFLVLLVLLPGLYHLVAPLPGENPYGLSARNFTNNMRLYLPLLAIMLPVLWIACSSPAFNEFYPLYKPATLRDLVLYEAIYLTQFIAVEFFYRGFCLFRFERLAPGLAIFIMVIPYALLHIHKPFPEALGSVVAGLVLGALALKSRSIWPGVLTHCTVALSADLFALLHSGRMAQLLQ